MTHEIILKALADEFRKQYSQVTPQASDDSVMQTQRIGCVYAAQAVVNLTDALGVGLEELYAAAGLEQMT